MERILSFFLFSCSPAANAADGTERGEQEGEAALKRSHGRRRGISVRSQKQFSLSLSLSLSLFSTLKIVGHADLFSLSFVITVHKPDPVSRCGHALRVFRFSLFPDVYVLGIHHLQRQATQEKDEKISHDRGDHHR